MKKFFIAGFTLLFSAITLAAPIRSLSRDEVLQALTNKTLIMVPLIVVNNQLNATNSISIFIQSDGTIQGLFNNKPEFDLQNDKGSWKVLPNGTMCVTWHHWKKGNPICFNIYSTHNSLLFINSETNDIESMALKINIKEYASTASGTDPGTANPGTASVGAVPNTGDAAPAAAVSTIPGASPAPANTIPAGATSAPAAPAAAPATPAPAPVSETSPAGPSAGAPASSH